MTNLPEEELYLYAVVLSGAAASLGSLGPIGLFGQEVRPMLVGRIAAVVSAVPDGTGKIRPERRNLMAHQAVISRLTGREFGLLPVAFGTISPGPTPLAALLARYETDLLAQLKRVGAAVEMEVRAELNVPNVFEYFVNARPELRAERDRVFGSGNAPSRDDKIALGQLFQRILDEEREAMAERFIAALEPNASEIQRNDCRSEKELVRLSVLLSLSDQARFDLAIDGLGRELAEEHNIVVTGPFPAYSFVDVHLHSP
ncbi:MAG: GvpL/GvpF family gas vesicle protein [Deltaproteobacteria bacterium]|nr:GvpL/GvpF family gas vesicle protein [Deltaproteobacteria bacterium]